MKKAIVFSIFLVLSTTITFSQSTGKTIHLTKAEFLKKVVNYEKNPEKWVYLGDKPCIIDFYATWCTPCKKIAPILEEIAQEYKDDLYIYKVDTGKESELAQDFGIQSVPTLIFCPVKGKPSMSRGSLPEETLKKIIHKDLLKKK